MTPPPPIIQSRHKMGDARDIRAYANRRSTNYITINAQQDKLLQQLQRSLGAEKVYAVKALDGDQNIMRARQQRFKSKVARIKSHLTEEEIVEFKRRDGVASRASSKSHIGISSNTGTTGSRQEKHHRSRSACGRLQTRRTITVIESVANENKDSNLSNNQKRKPRPVLVKHQQIRSPASTSVHPSESDSFSEEEISLPKTSAAKIQQGARNKKSNVAFKHIGTPRSRGNLSSRQPTPIKSALRFSCHEISNDEDAKVPEGGRGSAINSASLRTQSRLMTPSIKRELSPEEKVRLEFRQMLLDGNEQRVDGIQRRTNEFLQKVSYDMQRETREREERERQIARQRAEELEATRQNSTAAKLERLRGDIRRKKLERMTVGHDGVNEDMLERKGGENDEDYEKRMEEWREEMKRTRYLRLEGSEGGRELQDVVTLVTAGMAANKIWREGLAHDLI